MYKFIFNNDKNRIYIYIGGSLADSELEKYKNELIEMINKTHTGFTVFADSSKSSISFLENSVKLQGARDYGVTRGFKGVATVLSYEAFEIHQKKPFPGIKNVFTDVIEAEQFLDTLG